MLHAVLVQGQGAEGVIIRECSPQLMTMRSLFGSLSFDCVITDNHSPESLLPHK